MQNSAANQPVSGSRTRVSAALRTLGIAGLFTAIFCWVYGTTIVEDQYLVWSDLYENYLPGFLSPLVTWSTYEFTGVPTFADFIEPTGSPVFLLFSKVLHWWTAYIVFAYILGSFGTYVYVAAITGSRVAGVIVGLGFGVSEAMLERLSHLTTVHTTAWLPVALYCVERLRSTNQPRWAGLGAVSLAIAILSGHPQPAMYVAMTVFAYAVVAGRAERQPKGYWQLAAALFVLAGLLSLIKVLPFAELTLNMSRDTISFDHFVQFANTLPQMWSMLFPTILHDGREAPTYVGLGLTLFAILGATQFRRNWRVTFWVVTTVIALLFGVGQHTPFGKLAYDFIPLYDKFRVAARHLIISSFGLAVLAGFGLQLALTGAAPIRRRLVVLTAFLALFLAGLWVMTHPPAGLQFESRSAFAWSAHGLPPIMPNELWTQTGLALATIAIAAGLMFTRRKLPWAVLLAVVVFVDALNAQPFRIKPLGLDSVVMSTAAAEPSVHAVQIREDLAPLQQRVLAIGNMSTDAVSPSTWTRLWSIPSAGGYGPMLLERLAVLATMGRNGGVTNRVLAPYDTALDALAVREIIVKPSDIESSGTFSAGGIVWEKQQLDLSIGRADCGHEYPRTVSLALPPGIELSAVHATMYLRCAEEVPQDTEVGSIALVAEDGQRHTKTLRAGVDVAESSLLEPSVLARARHRATPRFPDPDVPNGLHSVVTLSAPAPMRAVQLEVTAAASRGWLNIGRLTLVDKDGRMLPQTMGPLFLNDTERWRELRRVRTSRTTDRGRDEDTPDEIEVTIYENRRAMPRVWLAREARFEQVEDILSTMKWGQLPDGRRFDLAATALVDAGDAPPSAKTFPGAGATLQFAPVVNGRMEATVSSSGGAFLVFSENYYPGWRAEVDGQRTRIYRTDYALQGIEVPPGTHRVLFTFVPLTMYAGGALSLAALVAVGMLVAGRGWPRRTDRRDQQA